MRDCDAIERERLYWWRLACGRLGILYDIMKIRPQLEDFILDAIKKLDATVAKEKR